ncbi:MAG: hypothetical protein DMF60_07810 [Acidobacteria bacterium]|nr:MAG: hypothetical protein DMF60_07810 [Acidobacteriota bacterium]
MRFKYRHSRRRSRLLWRIGRRYVRRCSICKTRMSTSSTLATRDCRPSMSSNVIGAAATTVIPGGLSNAFGQLFSYNYTGYSLGFSFVLPLSNKASEADHERALNEQRLSKSKLEVTAQQIALEVRTALTQVEMNRARIETAKTTKDLAQQKMEAEQTKFSLGTSTLRFVLEEQRNVAQAESNELQTVVNFTKGLVDLDKAMGLTLSKNNIEIDKTLRSGTTAK